MLDRIKGLFGGYPEAPIEAVPVRSAQVPVPRPIVEPKELRPVDRYTRSAKPATKQLVAQVNFFGPARNDRLTTRHQAVRGTVADFNPADPQVQALLGRLFGSVRVSPARSA